ncbi:MAG: PEP-CTERM sorting domain-containing protein [Alphaproteobacteria bacterium]|nr:PEP-CTERM sorting domain-containing protein [Alphaproteobacteria bacterium]
MSITRNIKAAAGAAVLAFGLAGGAQAAIIPFTDVVMGPVTLTVGGTDTHSFTHDINDSINIATDIIGGGNLAIVLQDIGGSESTQISFDLGSFIALSGNVSNAGETFNFGLATFNLIASLQADGLLGVRIKVIQQGSGLASNVVFSSSTLTGFAERPDQNVPEPAALLLLGGGLLGLAALRRRKAA